MWEQCGRSVESYLLPTSLATHLAIRDIAELHLLLTSPAAHLAIRDVAELHLQRQAVQQQHSHSRLLHSLECTDMRTALHFLLRGYRLTVSVLGYCLFLFPFSIFHFPLFRQLVLRAGPKTGSSEWERSPTLTFVL